MTRGHTALRTSTFLGPSRTCEIRRCSKRTLLNQVQQVRPHLIRPDVHPLAPPNRFRRALRTKYPYLHATHAQPNARRSTHTHSRATATLGRLPPCLALRGLPEYIELSPPLPAVLDSTLYLTTLYLTVLSLLERKRVTNRSLRPPCVHQHPSIEMWSFEITRIALCTRQVGSMLRNG